jgi:tetratricopeptide (TPR) repeat protein
MTFAMSVVQHRGRIMVKVLLLLAQLASTAAAQPSRQTDPAAIADSARRTIEAAQFVADTARLDAMRVYLRSALQQHPGNALLAHYAGYAGFRRVNLVPERDTARIRWMLLETRRLLERSIAQRPMAESYALLSSIIGRQIGYFPEGADTLITQANAATIHGLNLHSDNPRVWLMSGIGAFYTAPEHGGGYPKAEQQLRRAIRFFESERVSPPLPSWGHAEAWCWLGQALARQGKIAEARAAYERALQLEPEFGWVRYELLPALARAS